VDNGSGTAYAGGAEYTITATTTLFAQWVETFTVTYDGNTSDDGTPPTDPNSPYAASSVVTVLGNTDLAKDGHVFAGWNTAANGSGTSYAAAATFTIAANTILYAQWVSAYTVTYEGNTSDDGTPPTDPNSPYAASSVVTVLGNTDLAKAGHVFGGWNTTAAGDGTRYAAGDTYTLTADTTLYAVWVDDEP
jgi:uncharacterized repeat protein (TIGR02543 family)